MHSSIRALIAATALLATLAGVSASAHATAPDRSHWVDEATLDDYCGFAGLHVHRTFTVDETFHSLHEDNWIDFTKVTYFAENLDNGKTLTVYSHGPFHQLRHVDNGDGTFTVYFSYESEGRAYDTDGNFVGLLAGNIKWVSLYDTGTDTWTDLSFRSDGPDSIGYACAPGGLVEQYLI